MDSGTLDLVPMLAIIAGSFFLGGVAKGASGLGLPLIAVPILANVMSVATAIALLAIPILTTNFYQLARSGVARETIERFRLMAATLAVGSTLGALLLVGADQQFLSILLGTILIAVVAIRLLPADWVIRPGAERWVGAPVGFVAGIVGGTSSLFGPPVIAYLVALRLDKNHFVAAVSFVFLAGSLPLNTVLVAQNVLGRDEFLLSLLGCLPVFLGLRLGRELLRVMSPLTFQRFILVLVTVMGASLIHRGIA